MDYKRNRRYFESINWILIGAIIVVAAILLYFFLLIGIAIFLGLGVYIYFKLRDRPTDEEIDAVFKEYAQTARQRGYGKLGLNSEDINLIEPIVFHGPLLDQISYDPVVKKGKDQKIRSSNHEVITFYFKEQQVYFYYQGFSMIDDERNEITGNCFYKDIMSISTASTTTMYFNNVRKRDEFFNLDVLKLITSGTMNVECATQDLETIQGDIRRMRNLLHQKKNAS